MGAIIAIAVVVLLIIGFCWTRGARGGIPGGSDDPASQQLIGRFDSVGEPLPPAGGEPEHPEREID
jgi:hypothetical protein